MLLYGHPLTKLLGNVTITTPRTVAPTSTISPFGRSADLMGPIIGSRIGMTFTRA